VDPKPQQLECSLPRRLTLGALAITDVAPDIAEKTVEFALRDVPVAMKHLGTGWRLA